jgi:hypothetical protein
MNGSQHDSNGKLADSKSTKSNPINRHKYHQKQYRRKNEDKVNAFQERNNR